MPGTEAVTLTCCSTICSWFSTTRISRAQRIGLGHIRLIESRLFDAQAIGRGSLQDIRPMSGVVGRQTDFGRIPAPEGLPERLDTATPFSSTTVRITGALTAGVCAATETMQPTRKSWKMTSPAHLKCRMAFTVTGMSIIVVLFSCLWDVSGRLPVSLIFNL